MIKNYFVSTGHLEDGLWFREREDFVVGMNHVAVQVAEGNVVVLAFILMSNHVHFALKGEYEDVLDFISGLKQRYSMYYSRKYGAKGFLRKNDLDVKEFQWCDEAPERTIAYVQMNCVAANICANPTQYPWGSGSCFFNENTTSGRKVSSLSARKIKHILHSGVKGVPGHWIIGEEDYILPQNYVDVETVEHLFRKPSRMNYFLNTSSKARKRLEINEKQLPSFKDQVILSALSDLCMTLFQKRSFAELEDEEKTECARQIRYRFSASPNQIARVCGVSYEEIAKILDGM